MMLMVCSYDDNVLQLAGQILQQLYDNLDSEN